MITGIKAALEALASVFRHQTHRSERHNTDEMVRLEIARRRAEIRDEIRRAVKDQDSDRVRKLLS